MSLSEHALRKDVIRVGVCLILFVDSIYLLFVWKYVTSNNILTTRILVEFIFKKKL